MFQRNGSMEAPRMNDPILDTTFNVVNPSVGR